MRCPKCNGKLSVKDIVHNKNDNEVYRKRICKECGETIFTTEFEVDPDMDYNEDEDDYLSSIPTDEDDDMDVPEFDDDEVEEDDDEE